MPRKTLLAGLGNPLSGDDGFGPGVVEALRGANLPPGVTLIDAGTDLLNHIESFVEYDCVILIDAILDPDGKIGPPGQFRLVEEGTFASWPEGSQGVHQMSPMLAVKLFRTLHPDAHTVVLIAGLFVDRISHSPRYLNVERIKEALNTIKSAF